MKIPQLIVALDVPDIGDLLALLARLPSEITWFKVGLELFVSAGPAVLFELKSRKKKIFLDLKFHDIPRTVSRAIHSAARHGVDMLTVHAGGGRGMLSAAAEAARTHSPQPLQVIAVTTLTSLNQDDFADLGISGSVSDRALALGELALDCGLDGLVTSAHELAGLRKQFGLKPILVTPGIQPEGKVYGDQKRIATPIQAVRDGADFLVVGRAILESSDPLLAARRIIEDMNRAARER